MIIKWAKSLTVYCYLVRARLNFKHLQFINYLFNIRLKVPSTPHINQYVNKYIYKIQYFNDYVTSFNNQYCFLVFNFYV